MQLTSRLMTHTLLVALAFLGTGAFAHATLVLGTLTSTPRAPQAGEPFSLRLELQDPTQVPTEDALVIAEFRPVGTPNAEPIRAEFEETGVGGVYRARTSLPEAGSWQLHLRDQTFRQEETTADVTLNVGRPNPVREFVFPPTSTVPRNPWVWLAWLIGVPIVAAVAVTVLVLTREDKPQRA